MSRIGLVLAVLLALPAAARADDAADAVATELVSHVGDPHGRAHIAFTFVVTRDGAVLVERSFDWWPQAQTVTFHADGGDVTITCAADPALGEAAREPEASADLWARCAAGATPEAAAEAWGAFVNDSFWLTAPAKVLDPGAVRTLDEAGRLVVAYEGVGVTPGDEYAYTIAEDGDVSAWTFTLGSGREGTFAWTDWVELGGLRLSLLRTSDDGSTTIGFRDVLVE